MSTKQAKTSQAVVNHRCILAKKFVMDARHGLARACQSCVDREPEGATKNIEGCIADLEAALRELSYLNKETASAPTNYTVETPSGPKYYTSRADAYQMLETAQKFFGADKVSISEQ